MEVEFGFDESCTVGLVANKSGNLYCSYSKKFVSDCCE